MAYDNFAAAEQYYDTQPCDRVGSRHERKRMLQGTISQMAALVSERETLKQIARHGQYLSVSAKDRIADAVDAEYDAEYNKLQGILDRCDGRA